MTNEKPTYLKLKNHMDVPPHEFYWIDPTTKIEMRASDIETLFLLARQHRVANKLPIPDDYDAFIEDAICKRAPECFVNHPATFKTNHIGMDDVLKKTDALMRAARKNGGKLFCDEEEAVERSKICVACDKNKRIMCQTCNGVLAWMRQSFSLPKLPQDEELQTCQIFTVMNKAQVHLHAQVIRMLISEDKADRFPEACWKRKLLTTKEQP